MTDPAAGPRVICNSDREYKREIASDYRPVERCQGHRGLGAAIERFNHSVVQCRSDLANRVTGGSGVYPVGQAHDVKVERRVDPK